jgi:D-alanyl-lipoteichoic acid acyltransferase DltB (MBOAT superfamily)
MDYLMINKLKTLLTSDEGMKMVNLLFLLSALSRNRGIIFIAYIIWIVYLVYCIKRTSSKSVRIIYGILIVFAAVMIAFNLYFLVVKLITSRL